jgi:Ni,Fe-hydrogenase I large subunit
MLEELEVGYEVVLEAKRDLFHNGEGNHAGQIALTNATLVANFYGNHDYCTDFFITDKTLADIVALDVNEHHSTEVYVVKAVVEFVETAYYTSLNVSYNGTTLKLYMSGAGQYSWLKAFTGQEVTMEVAPCNWNNKKDEYRGCVLAVILEDGTKIVNTLNFN